MHITWYLQSGHDSDDVERVCGAENEHKDLVNVSLAEGPGIMLR